jgi:hypothetical protein
MPRPLGDRTRWTYGYHNPADKSHGALTIAGRLFSGRFGAEEAAERFAAESGYQVTPPLRVRIEIPRGVRR